ncbi:ABC transporter permease [Acidobacteriota bacterium]
MDSETGTTTTLPNRQEEGFFKGILVFLRKGCAFIVRDFFQEISYRLAAFMSVASILFQVTLFFFISRLIEGKASEYLQPYGGSYFAFVIIGMAFYSVQNIGTSVFSASLRQGQMMGTLEAMLLTPTDAGLIIFFSSLWSYIRTSVNMVIFLAIGACFGMAIGNANFIAVLIFFLLGILAFSSIGVLSACFILVFKRGNPVASVFSMGSLLFGGVYFPVEVLPEWLHWFANLLPITHVLHGVRDAMINGASFFDLLDHAAYLSVFSLLVCPIAIIGFRLAIRQAKREGTLAQY